MVHRNFDVIELGDIKAEMSKLEVEKEGIRDSLLSITSMGINARYFSLDKSKLLSLYSLCKEVVDQNNGNKSGKDNVIFKRNEVPLLFHYHEGFLIKIGPALHSGY